MGDMIDLTDEIMKATEEYEKVWNEAYEQMENKAEEFVRNIGRIFDNILYRFKAGNYEGIGSYISDGLTDALNSIPWDTVYSESTWGRSRGTEKRC